MDVKDKAITLYIENYVPGRYGRYIREFLDDLTQSVVTQFAVMSLTPDGSRYKLRIYKDGIYDRTVISADPSVFKSIIYRLIIVDPSCYNDSEHFMPLFNIMKIENIPTEIIGKDHVLSIGNDDTNKFSNKMISLYVSNFSTVYRDICILTGIAWNSMIESYNLKNVKKKHRTVFLLDHCHDTMVECNAINDIVTMMKNSVHDEILVAVDPISDGYGWMGMHTIYPRLDSLWIKGISPGENISVINQFQLTDYDNGNTSKGIKTDIYVMGPIHKFIALNIFVKAHISNLFSNMINVMHDNIMEDNCKCKE